MSLSESPSIEELRLLVHLAETRNVTKTAEEFGVKQPSVTKRLEPFRDQGLLASKGAVFTAQGQDLLPAIRELLRQYDQIKACLDGKRSAPSVVSLATGSSASQYFLPAAIAGMRKRVPGVEIETRATRGKERVLGTAEGRFDLAIVSHDPPQIKFTLPGPRQLTIEPLATQPLCVIAQTDSPEAAELAKVLAGQEVPLEKLCDWPLVGLDRDSGVRRQIEREFVTRSEPLRYTAEAAGWLAVREYVAFGLGVGIMPIALLSRQDEEKFVIRRLPRAICVRHYLIHRTDAANPHLGDMKAALQEAAALHETQIRRTWQGVI